jgi:hypothetical protein
LHEPLLLREFKEASNDAENLNEDHQSLFRTVMVINTAYPPNISVTNGWPIVTVIPKATPPPLRVSRSLFLILFASSRVAGLIK